jgi:DNA (cytosine-5)-methyltransferase 1
MYPVQPLDLLRQARIRYTQGEIATLLDVDVRTVRRWEVRDN